MGKEIGEAYVKIMPTTKGIAGKIGEALENVEKGKEYIAATKRWGKSIASAAVGAFAATKVWKAAGETIREAIGEGAKLEQSIGGIETLFGTGGKTLSQYAETQGKSIAEVVDEYWRLERAQTIVFNNADAAFKTAGVSANEYMELVTSFAAALNASLGGNTIAAAKAADQAIIDIADNANKMGTPLESIQEAYKSFARQQYQLLDNLKLGYGGTKGEMERLLKDAQKISGIEYNIDNLADVYNAIHVIQTELGITGTTAEEAERTISGSAASMKAAWQNMLGKAALGEDVEKPMQEVVTTARTYLEKNLLPAVWNVVKSIPSAFSGLGADIDANLPDMAAKGVRLVSELLDGVSKEGPEVGKTLKKVISAAAEEALKINWWDIGVGLIKTVIGGVLSMRAEFENAVWSVIKGGTPSIGSSEQGDGFSGRAGKTASVTPGAVVAKTSAVQAITSATATATGNSATNRSTKSTVNVTQNIYAKKQSAAELMAESRWQAEKAVLKLV